VNVKEVADVDAEAVTVTPDPAIAAVAPTKFEPEMVTARVEPAAALAGMMLVMVGG
jgi:hypothetical protein